MASLLAAWANSSPHAMHQFNNAVQKVGPSALRSARSTGPKDFAQSLLRPLDAVALLLNLRAPKSSFRVLSELMTLRGIEYEAKVGGPFPRPLCTCTQYDKA